MKNQSTPLCTASEQLGEGGPETGGCGLLQQRPDVKQTTHHCGDAMRRPVQARSLRCAQHVLFVRTLLFSFGPRRRPPGLAAFGEYA